VRSDAARVDNLGNLQELRLAAGADPQRVLAELVGRTRLRSFEITKPSLHDIFVRIARPDRQEAPHA
jgi:ABC-2 type transport system ATP-binding protein